MGRVADLYAELKRLKDLEADAFDQHMDAKADYYNSDEEDKLDALESMREAADEVRKIREQIKKVKSDLKLLTR